MGFKKMKVITMAYSDHLIKPELLKLSQNGTVTYREISESLNIPESTVRDSVKRMLKNGVIARSGKGSKGSFTYHETSNSLSA